MSENTGFFIIGFLVSLLFCLWIWAIFTPDYKKEFINSKGFCIESKVSGVEFKKCYELKERP